MYRMKMENLSATSYLRFFVPSWFIPSYLVHNKPSLNNIPKIPIPPYFILPPYILTLLTSPVNVAILVALSQIIPNKPYPQLVFGFVHAQHYQ